MATIELYASKMNQMPGLIKNVKKSVIDYKSELSKLKKKSLSVDRQVCNMDDIISSVQSSTQTQEKKIEFLEKLNKDSEQFITETAKIDANVADVVNKRKNDFYEKYYYLKPECEKTKWEKFKDGCKKVGEWCKEHWKVIVAAVVVIIGVVLAIVFPVLAPLLLLAGKGALLGAITGGLIGGTLSALAGESFWKGFEDGAFTGAIMGALGGAGEFLGGSCEAIKALGGLDKVRKAITIAFKVSGGITTVMGGFDMLSMGLGVVDPNNPLVLLNKKFHSSALYNGVQFLAGAAAAFSGGAYLRMKQGPPACFVAGTMILTAAGLIAIESIKAGDKVIATDPVTFLTSEKRVVETYIREVPHLVHIKLHNEEIKTTVEHPFYVKDQGFVKARELHVGDLIMNAAGGACVVEEVCLDVVEQRETVYNFQVEEFHTYYVGESNVLVHNAQYGKGTRAEWDNYFDDIEKNTGKKLTQEQKDLVMDEINKNPHDTKLTGQDYSNHRADFNNQKDALISNWEKNTGDTWPTYQNDVVSKKGNPYIKAGDKFDAHEIIPNVYDSPLEWWNLHPAARPGQHQGGIHGVGAAIKKIFG